MRAKPSLFDAWRLAELKMKRLHSRWTNALNANDASACELWKKLVAQRQVAHDAFAAALAAVAAKAEALHYRRQRDVPGLE